MAQTVQTGLLKQFQSRLGQIAKKVTESPIEWGREQDPPPGVRNGVAQLVECGFGEFKTGNNKGQPFWRGAGVIQEPHTVIVDGQEVACAGKQTSITIALVDRKGKDDKIIPATVALEDAVNEMRKLLYPYEIDPKMLETEKGYYDLAAALSRQKPYFGFSTSKRDSREYIDPKTKEKKMSQPGVWQNWHGTKDVLEWTPSANGQAMDASALGEPLKDPGNVDGAVDEQPAVEDQAAVPQEDIDVSALVIASKRKDGDAQLKLKELADQCGMTTYQFDAADWDDIGAFIMVKMEEAAGGETALPTEEVVAEPVIPLKGEVWVATLSKPGTKKGTVIRRSVKVEVLTVNVKNETVTLQDTETKKPIMDDGKPVAFKFADLTPA